MIRATVAFLLLICSAGAQAQSVTPDTTRRTPGGVDSTGWNSPRALELIDRARLRREQPLADSALRNYTADARGHVYFFLDRRDNNERTLVKTDQIALELFWAAPDLTKQRIVGLRDESRLPNRMRYHLDHLTVVQNGFGDLIRVGDGDEVRDVPHPAAPGSTDVYDFQLADSMTLNLAGSPPVRVYEINIRPKRTDAPGLVGSIFIEQNAGDIVRMTFTFTPASYVDRRLDYINISLDNGLWQGKYWLPNEQFVQIRRQVPELDFVAGAVIQGRFRVFNYAFNLDLPRTLFLGRAVESVPEEQRRAFHFEEDLYAGLEQEGLTEPPQIENVRAEAIRLLRNRRLTGLPRFRLNVPNASAVARHNRTEGAYLGAGATYVPGNNTRFDATFGYAFGLEKPELTLGARRDIGSGSALHARGYYNEPRDIGIRSDVPGVLNTAAGWFGRDYTDLYFTSGGELEFSRRSGNRRAGLALGVEAHRSRSGNSVASVGSDEDRPPFPADEGTLVFARGTLDLPLLERTRTSIRLGITNEAGVFGLDTRACPLGDPVCNTADGPFSRTVASVTAAYEPGNRAADVTLRFSGGALFGDAPIQKFFFFGGYGTIPGHTYRGMIGRRFALAELEAARTVWRPWLRLRATAAAGISSGFDPQVSPFLSPRYSEAASIGIGVGLLWDAIRLDLVKGRGKPRLYFSIDPQFRDML